VLLAGNATAVAKDDSLSSLATAAVISADDFRLRGAGERSDCE